MDFHKFTFPVTIKTFYYENGLTKNKENQKMISFIKKKRLRRVLFLSLPNKFLRRLLHFIEERG